MIFAVSTVSTRSSSWQYVDFSKLCATTISHREDALKVLTRRSIYSSGIEVSVDNQLLLITCVDDDEERRVIAARRIREDETEDELNKVIKRTTRK